VRPIIDNKQPTALFIAAMPCFIPCSGVARWFVRPRRDVRHIWQWLDGDAALKLAQSMLNACPHVLKAERFFASVPPVSRTAMHTCPARRMPSAISALWLS
jgi:hypothetical protein